jgi:hypothetical protein
MRISELFEDDQQSWSMKMVANPDRMPLRYWYNPSTDEIRELSPTTEHAADVLNNPDHFQVSGLGTLDPTERITSGQLRKIVQVALDNGWVRVIRLRPDTSVYMIEGNNPRHVLKAARRFDKAVHPITRLTIEGHNLRDDDLALYLKYGRLK